jgi:DNA-binding winged helix-turn-helix (wHTH) protein/tetratricopeptide (TPR) repeat protein
VTRPSASNRKRYRFGEFLLDPPSRALRCGDSLLTLSPKVFDCIVYLIEDRDRAIGGDEIAAAVWGRADIADVQLRQLMRKVRRALHDDGGRQMAVRTIPHFGFHWVAETAVEDAEDFHSTVALPHGLASRRQIDDQPAPRTPLSPSSKARSMVSAIRIAASGCLLTLLILPLAADDRMSPSTIAVAARSVHRDDATGQISRDAIGVLPVEVQSASDADGAWIRLGLMDLIASDLRNASLPVLPSSNVVALDRDLATDAALTQRVRAATNARNLVLPSAVQTGDRWNVRLDMTDGEGRLHTVQAQSSDIVTAAHDASDRLLVLLGKSRTVDFAARSPSKAQLLQRIEAAMLVDDYDAARRQIEAAPRALRELPELQIATASAEIALHENDKASARLTTLLETVSAEADPVLRARALTGLATIHRRESAAIAWLTEAIGLLDKQEEPRYLAAACNVRGYIYSLDQRYDDALADYARARTAFALANDELGSARVDNGEAIVDLMRGHAADALPLFERAARGFERFGALDKLASVLINQISTYLELLQPLESLAAYERAESKLEHSDDAQMLRWLRTQGAKTLAANGRLREARALLDGVLRTADPADEIDLLSVAWRARAELDLLASQPDSAITFAKRTIDILAAAGHGEGESASASVVFIRALRAANQREEAARQSAALTTWARTQENPATVLRVRLVEAEEAWSAGHRELAIQRYEDALQIAGNGGTPLDVSDVTASYGNALLDVQDLPRASIVIGRMSRWTDRDFASALLQARLYQALGQRDAWQAALDHARKLAGERTIPANLAVPPREAPILAERRGPAPPKFQ